MIVVGIDPGLSGAIAVWDVSNKLLAIHDMPTVSIKSGKSTKNQLSEAMLASIIRQVKPEHAYLEFVSAMPGQGVSSMFNFGMGYGAIKGVLAALEVPFTTVTPVKWQRDLAVAKGKEGNRLRAAQLFPEYAHLFVRVKDDGRADAALLAHWGAVQSYQARIATQAK